MNRESIHGKLDREVGPKEDQRTVYIGNTTLMIEKRFRPPISPYCSDMLKKYFLQPETFDYDILPNFDFNIKFYFPRTNIIKRFDAGVQDRLHLIVMFNGLDESLPRHYKLYDRLGSSFAFHGIASVLLPTPFHLNRSAVHKTDITSNGDPVRKKPSEALEDNPWYLPNNFAQNINEFKCLLKLINCKFDFRQHADFKDMDIKIPTNDDQAFYKLFFKDKRVDVSLLGYSMGGLKALACFKQNPDPIKTCIVLNAGGTLENLELDLPGTNKESWREKVVNPILKKVAEDEHKREYDAYAACEHRPIIDSILTEPKVFDEPKYDRHVCKIIIVAGGKDRLVKPESITRLETKAHGLNILQIADLGHFIGNDSQFSLWYSRIINLLINFFENIGGEPISTNANLALFSVFDFCCNNELVKGLGDSKNLSELVEIVVTNMGVDFEKDFYLIARSSHAYHKTIQNGLSENGILERGLISKLSDYKEKRKLFFGQLATKYTKSRNYEDIKKVVLQPNGSLLSGRKLFEAGELPAEFQIDSILENQVEQYIKSFGGDDSVISENWKQTLLPLLKAKKRVLAQESQTMYS